MGPRFSLAAASILMVASVAVQIGAQGAPAQPPAQTPPAAPAQTPPQGPPGGGRGRGQATFPAQQRPAGDPAVIARGQQLYSISCRACHGVDLRGGDMGGPNLLRSQLVLNDQDGELILPVVQNGRMNVAAGMPVMPPLPIPPDDVKAIATYIHSVAASARGQGAPPAGPAVELNILVGDATAGQAYFQAKCSSCHSPTGDLAGIATRVGDPMALQNLWVGGGGGRGGANRKPVTATIAQASGEKITGRLVRIDDFIVVIANEDGSTRSFRRTGDAPKVEITDPLAGHKKLLLTYTDKDMHDVTAYLVTLK